MAFSVDAVSHYGSPGWSTNPTWDHTCAASANKLVVLIGFGRNYDSITGVTYNGDAMTRVGEAATGDWGRSQIWELHNPDTGSAYSIVVQTAPDAQLAGGAISFIDAATALGAAASDTGTTANPSLSVSSASGDIVVSVVTEENESSNTTEGGTLIFEDESVAAAIDVNAQRVTASGTTTACNWTNSGTAFKWAAIGVAVKAGAVTATKRLLTLGAG